MANEFKVVYDAARETNKAPVAGTAAAAPSPAKPAAAAKPTVVKAAPAAHEDKSGPVPASDNLDTIYGTGGEH